MGYFFNLNGNIFEQIQLNRLLNKSANIESPKKNEYSTFIMFTQTIWAEISVEHTKREWLGFMEKFKRFDNVDLGFTQA